MTSDFLGDRSRRRRIPFQYCVTRMAKIATFQARQLPESHNHTFLGATQHARIHKHTLGHSRRHVVCSVVRLLLYLHRWRDQFMQLSGGALHTL